MSLTGQDTTTMQSLTNVNYNLGDKIPLFDGIHFGYEGAFIVKENIIVAIFDSDEPFMFDKWGWTN